HGGDAPLDVSVVGGDARGALVPDDGAPDDGGERGRAGEREDEAAASEAHGGAATSGGGAPRASARRQPPRNVEGQRRRVAERRKIGTLGQVGRERFRDLYLAEHQRVLD